MNIIILFDLKNTKLKYRQYMQKEVRWKQSCNGIRKQGSNCNPQEEIKRAKNGKLKR